MTGRIEHFNARPDGSYRLVLAYADASVPQRDPLRNDVDQGSAGLETEL